MGGYGQTYTEEEAKKAFQDAAEEKEKKKPEIMEDWKTLKTWKGHHSRSKSPPFNFYANYYCAAISDLAWSPDNMHFASCSTDSTINIWHINEHCKFTKV